MDNSIVKERQQPLMDKYVINPQAALITDMAFIEGRNYEDPLHTSVFINEELKVPFPIGVHRAVGGDHDFPNSGDLLCASLATCFETTLRMIANRMNIAIENTRITATAIVDVRGTLMVDKTVPVGFQSMKLEVGIKTVNFIKDEFLEKLIKATERSCIIFQTINKGIPISLKIDKL
jgi:uncharacterized OsmC-like protein